MRTAQPGGRAIRAFRSRLGLRPDGWSLLDTGAALTLGLVSPQTSTPARLAIDLPTRGIQRLVRSQDRGGLRRSRGLPRRWAAADRRDPGNRGLSARTDFFERAAGGWRPSAAGPSSSPPTSRTRTPFDRGFRAAATHLAVRSAGALLERSRGAIHAGGFGTTALTVTAGVPSAISPCFNDSYWQARRHEELGIGIRIRRGNLRAAVERLVTDDDLHDRARTLGERIAHEDGTRNACDQIETFLTTSAGGMRSKD